MTIPTPFSEPRYFSTPRRNGGRGGGFTGPGSRIRCGGTLTSGSRTAHGGPGIPIGLAVPPAAGTQYSFGGV
jgi:hypothetical protein